MRNRTIPLLRSHISASILDEVRQVFDRGYLADGIYVEEFGKALSLFIGNPYHVMVSDVSAAITLALVMSGVHPGDEVIAPPMCCTSMTMPIANLFARPVWCDVDPDTGMIDADMIPSLVTEKTKAVLFNHWSGDLANIQDITQAASESGLRTIEDASESIGAQYCDKLIGNCGTDFTVFSFHAVKHITTIEGGALFCKSEADSMRGQMLKRYGIDQLSFRLPCGDLNPQSDIPEAGYNFYMTNVAGAIGIKQLEALPGILMRCRENGRYYDEALSGVPGISLARRCSDGLSAFWTYSMLVDRRSELQRALTEAGIGAQRLHIRNDNYTCFPKSNRPLPGTQFFDDHTLSVPCGWWVTDEDREYVVHVIRQGW